MATLLQPKPLSNLAAVPDEVPLLPSPSPAAQSLSLLQDLTAQPREPFFCCIDGGGTKTNVIILDANGIILGRGKSFGSNMTERGARQAAISIGRAVNLAMDMARERFPSFNLFSSYSLDLPDQPSSSSRSPASLCPFLLLHAGLAGIDVQKDAEIMHAELSSLFGLKSESEKKRLKVSNDCYLLASGIDVSHKWGIVLIAGTGSIGMAFARRSSGMNGHHTVVEEVMDMEKEIDGDILQLGRMGGYGYLLGDEGSAYWVGAEAVKAVLEIGDWHTGSYSQSKAFQGTTMHLENSSPLINLTLEHYGVSQQSDLLGAVYSQPGSEGQATSEHNRKVKIAEVARLVVACAFPSISLPTDSSSPPSPGAGDPLSLRVVRMAAEKLSEMVQNLCIAHGIDARESTLVLGTGMWSSEGFRRTVVELMEKDWVGKGGWGGVQMVDEPALAGARELLRRYRSISGE
ncbi:hypothetical protein BT69DRAFT_1335653 [Atractiella rhizophila]|nr:hypothetical protein BT69DRAFT_1335653 [Atractiella rhizophila]